MPKKMVYDKSVNTTYFVYKLKLFIQMFGPFLTTFFVRVLDDASVVERQAYNDDDYIY
jgi:hypothetical protein